MPTHTLTNPADAGATFADLFTVRLPPGWRDETAGMTPDDVFTRYGRTAGPLRLGHWQCTDDAKPAAPAGTAGA